MTEAAARPALSRPVLVAAGAIALVLGGSIWLWVRYGPAVFFETVRAGFVACFG